MGPPQLLGALLAASTRGVPLLALMALTSLTAVVLTLEWGWYPCGKFYLRPRRTPLWPQ